MRIEQNRLQLTAAIEREAQEYIGLPWDESMLRISSAPASLAVSAASGTQASATATPGTARANYMQSPSSTCNTTAAICQAAMVAHSTSLLSIRCGRQIQFGAASMSLLCRSSPAHAVPQLDRYLVAAAQRSQC